jgi:hypothetical protein
VSTQPISDERPKPCPKCGHEFMHYPWCEDDPVQKVGLPSILDIPADPFECLYRYIGLWDGVPKDEYEAALAALVAVRAELNEKHRRTGHCPLCEAGPPPHHNAGCMAAVSSPGEETP